jgi:transcriptional regulator with XRE-family HTH domain
MADDFHSLIADIEQEAHTEGPRAVRELEQFREEFSLASQLIQSRREGKLSQRELASLSGVPQSEISRIETGASNPTYATLSALLRPLGKRVQLIDDGGMIAERAKHPRPRRTATGAKTVGRRAATPRSVKKAPTAPSR